MHPAAQPNRDEKKETNPHDKQERRLGGRKEGGRKQERVGLVGRKGMVKVEEREEKAPRAGRAVVAAGRAGGQDAAVRERGDFYGAGQDAAVRERGDFHRAEEGGGGGAGAVARAWEGGGAIATAVEEARTRKPLRRDDGKHIVRFLKPFSCAANRRFPPLFFTEIKIQEPVLSSLSEIQNPVVLVQ